MYHRCIQSQERYKRGQIGSARSDEIGVKRLYILNTRDENAMAVTIRFEYVKTRTTALVGFINSEIVRNFSLELRSDSSSIFLVEMVSGSRKKSKVVANPLSALWNQNTSLQLLNVTIIPPTKGANAGPTNMPERKRPRAVARFIGV